MSAGVGYAEAVGIDTDYRAAGGIVAGEGTVVVVVDCDVDSAADSVVAAAASRFHRKKLGATVGLSEPAHYCSTWRRAVRYAGRDQDRDTGVSQTASRV